MKYLLLAVICFLTLFVGSAWVVGLSSSRKPKQDTKTIIPQVLQPTVEIKPESVTDDPKAGKQEVTVFKVVDGDTIKASIDGKMETIRIIGINSPETVDPRKTVECFGERASVIAKENLNGKIVWLEADQTQGERDKYNRLLRYVWIDDSVVDFGKVMVATGFAYEYTFGVPYKYQTEYKQAQAEAEKNKKGLWADDACPLPTIQPTVRPILEGTIVPSPSPTSYQMPVTRACKYSCSSPDRDCSDFSSHAEAQTFFECCGFTATNDPMKLDSVGVGDGIACESS